MNIKKLVTVVLNTLGTDKFSFNKETGDVEFSEAEKAKLGELFGEDFVAKFAIALSDKTDEASLDVMETIKKHNAKLVSDKTDEMNAEIAILRQQIAETNRKFEEKEQREATLKAENDKLKKTVSILAEEPETDDDLGEDKDELKVKKMFKVNPKHFHNQMAYDFLKGNSAKVIISRGSGFNFDEDTKLETINVSDLKSEFGTYLNQNGFDVIKKLTQELESTKYMTTKMAITEWRAAKSEITSVVQQFIAKWTPLAEASIKPCTVKNYRHKVNVPITPDDINDSWISYMYDESKTPDQMPITKYIIDELILPKVDDDRELRLLGQGVFEQIDPATVNTGDPGQATGKSMDGFVTIIEKAKSSGTSNMKFYEPVDHITDAGVNAVTWFEDFAKWIKAQDPILAKKGGFIFCPPEWVELYSYKYRDSFPLTKNEDGQKIKIDFTNFTLVGLPSMIGANCAFHTSKENFIHLKNLNDGASRIFLQVADYVVKVFAEWWEGVGFAVEEGVFAYAPDAGSGSGSGS